MSLIWSLRIAALESRNKGKVNYRPSRHWPVAQRLMNFNAGVQGCKIVAQSDFVRSRTGRGWSTPTSRYHSMPHSTPRCAARPNRWPRRRCGPMARAPTPGRRPIAGSREDTDSGIARDGTSTVPTTAPLTEQPSPSPTCQKPYYAAKDRRN